jgi:hypothetical protein
MTDYAINDFEAIRRRQEELKAQQDLALSGSTLPIEEIKTEQQSWAMYGTISHDYDPA